MGGIIGTRRAVPVAAVLAVSAVCWFGCGGDKDASPGKSESGAAASGKPVKFTDSRDGQEYRTVKIGGQAWMAENLNYQTGASWCYKDDESNCKRYGRLYDWNTAKIACPEGWHLPSREEWNGMVAAAGGAEFGKKLKSTYGWNENGNGTDEFGFSALPGSYRYIDGWLSYADKRGYWWTAAENGSGYAYYRYIDYDGNYVHEGYYDTRYGFSVRCAAD